uniref:Uncharacterized protein n=1 Tax=Octopus bimaculoides TaxID=37653 RepID=A0A0L8I7D7_OCTBM
MPSSVFVGRVLKHFLHMNLSQANLIIQPSCSIYNLLANGHFLLNKVFYSTQYVYSVINRTMVFLVPYCMHPVTHTCIKDTWFSPIH